MACPTCDHTLQGIGNGAFWCPRCGSLQLGNDTLSVPALAMRCRRMLGEIKDQATTSLSRQIVELLQRIGIWESCFTPEKRPRL